MAPDVSWVRTPAIWGTLAVELSLPVLLLVRRTRVGGLILGALFHLVLALAGNVPFAAVALAFYVGFIPPEVLRLRPARQFPVGAAAFAVPVAAWLVMAVVAPAPGVSDDVIGYLARAVVVVWVVGAAGALGPALLRERPPRTMPRLGHPALAIGLAVLVLNAATPYVGIESRGSFTMFSNLRTEPGDWNHLVVPARFRVFAHQGSEGRGSDASRRLSFLA